MFFDNVISTLGFITTQTITYLIRHESKKFLIQYSLDKQSYGIREQGYKHAS